MFIAYCERAHSITPIPSVDLIHGLHEPRPSFIVNTHQDTLLTLCIGHYVCEEDARLMIDEAGFIDALQERLCCRDNRRCVSGREGKLTARRSRVNLIRILPEA